MKLYTAQMAKHRLAASKGIPFYDTTVRSGKGLFRPSWEIVLSVKKGDMLEEVYTKRYKEILRESYRHQKEDWVKFLRQESVCVACYCRYGCFCHRFLLVDVLQKVAEKHNIPFEYCGEIQ